MGKQILVIDDEESIRKSFNLILDDAGYEVDTAASGEEGVEKFRGGNFSMVLPDLKMPGMDGVQTLTEIRKMNESVPVYIVTAFHAEFFGQLQVATEAGIEFDVMRKPVESDDLCAIVASVVG